MELGRALALEPKVLLLDEPMGGMNQDEKEDMARFVLDVNQERGVTVVLIEHDMGVVMDISDHVVVLDRGRKIAEGAPADVQANPAVIAGVPRQQPREPVRMKPPRRHRHRHAAQAAAPQHEGASPSRSGMREKDRGIWQSHTLARLLRPRARFRAGAGGGGFKRGDKLSVLGDNRARLDWAQLSAQALGGMAVPLYQDSIARELARADHAEVSIVVAEDQEQIDKVLSLRGELTNLRLVVYEDPRGMGAYTTTSSGRSPTWRRPGAPSPKSIPTISSAS